MPLLHHFEPLGALQHLEGKVSVVVTHHGVTALVNHRLAIHLERGAIHGHCGLLEIDMTIHIERTVTHKILVVVERLVLIDINRYLHPVKFCDIAFELNLIVSVAVRHIGKEVSTSSVRFLRGNHLAALRQPYLHIAQSRSVLEGDETADFTRCTTLTRSLCHQRLHTVGTLIRDGQSVFHLLSRLHIEVVVVAQLGVNR